MDSGFLGVNPILPVRSVDQTLRFYKERLGFRIVVHWLAPAYGVVRRGNTVIEFGEGRKSDAGSGVCNIHVANSDAIHKEWRSNDVEFVGDLADRDYGRRDFRVRDNNGNLLIVGHDLENQEELIAAGNIA